MRRRLAAAKLARALVSGVGKLHRAARRHGAHHPDRTAPELDFDRPALNDVPSGSVIEPPFKVEAARRLNLLSENYHDGTDVKHWNAPLRSDRIQILSGPL